MANDFKESKVELKNHFFKAQQVYTKSYNSEMLELMIKNLDQELVD